MKGKSYLAAGIRIKKKPVFRNAEDKNKTTMKKSLQREMENLRYRIRRYQSMGNGSMCQNLWYRLRTLEAVQAK